MTKTIGTPEDFNPRSPWGERQLTQADRDRAGGFQSTLPVGGATIAQSSHAHGHHRFQSTLPVGGATFLVFLGISRVEISIHAPRGGSDGTGRRQW